MRVGVPKGINNHEYRVGFNPSSVAELVAAGHEVVIETGARMGIDFSDQAYQQAGAAILPDAVAVFRAADMFVKVKEPQQGEIAMLEPRHLPIAAAIKEAELLIGAVLVSGAVAPKLATRDMLKTMKRGSVLLDIAIDQGGCFETSHGTTHDDPVYTNDGVIHYCVANMPGAVARTSIFALNNAKLPFALKLANFSMDEAMKADSHLADDLNVSGGQIRHEAVAEALDLPFGAA